MNALEQTRNYLAALSSASGESLMPELADLCIAHGVYHLSPDVCLMAARGDALAEYAPNWVPADMRTRDYMIVIWAAGDMGVLMHLIAMHHDYRYLAWARELKGRSSLRAYSISRFLPTQQ